jgi:hypothetical protein
LLRFSPIFCGKIGVFLKTQCYDPPYAEFSSVLHQKRHFSPIFWRKYLKNHDINFRWDGHPFTGHNSPMYARPESGELDPDSAGYQFNTNFSVNYWLQLGAKRETVPEFRLIKKYFN